MWRIYMYVCVCAETEAQVQSSERMTSLHSRLQQEAEKIRKWKNAIELDTKHKVMNMIDDGS